MNEGSLNSKQPESSKENQKFVEFYKSDIDSDDDFWNLIVDAKNQLAGLRMLAQIPSMTDEDFLLENEAQQKDYVSFGDYVKNNGITLSERCKNNHNVKKLTELYDWLAEELKNIKSKADFMRIMKVLDKIGPSFPLGIDKKESKNE